MKYKILIITFLLAGLAYGQAPIPLTIDSRSPTAPAIDPYQASRTVYRVSFTDGTNPVNLTGITGWMSWSTNSYASSISTASVAQVGAAANGVIDFTFSASSLNPSFGPGRYIYECGLRGSAGITVYRQGILTLRGSPYAVGVSPATWTTNAVNWATINWTGLPTTLAGYGIVDGVDITYLYIVSNAVVTAQADVDAHEAKVATNAHTGLGTASIHASNEFATSAQGVLAGTALQTEADTNAIAQLNTHTNLTAIVAHSGLGTAATNAATAFATSAQGSTADTAGANATAALAGVLAVSNRADNAETSTNTLNISVAALKTATNAINTRAGTLETATNTLQGQVTTLSTNAGTVANITALQSATNALNTRAGSLETSTNALQSQATALQGATGTLNTATNTLQTQVTALKSATNSLQTKVDALNTSTGALNTATTALQTSTNTLNTHAGTLDTATNSLNARAGTSETDITAIEASTNAINTRVGAAETVTNYLSGQVTALKTATNTLQTQATAAIAATGSLNTAVSALQTSTNTLDTSVTALKSATNNLNTRATANAGFTNYAYNAWIWGAHSNAGYLTSATNLFTGLYSANRAVLGANLSGLTQGTYTGVLTSVSYTGATVMVAGRTYAMGFTKANAFGTSTLSIASQSLVKTAAGATSNYFVYSGTDTNLILRLDGDGSSKSDVSGVYVKQITNGNISAAWDMDVGHNLTIDGTVFDWDTYVATNNSTYTATVAKAASALQAESDPVHTNWLATNAYVQSNSGNWDGTWKGFTTNEFANKIETASSSNTLNTAITNNLYLQSLTNIYFETSKTNLQYQITNNLYSLSLTNAYFESGKVATNDEAYLAARTNLVLSESTSNSTWRVGRTDYITINTNLSSDAVSLGGVTATNYEKRIEGNFSGATLSAGGDGAQIRGGAGSGKTLTASGQGASVVGSFADPYEQFVVASGHGSTISIDAGGTATNIYASGGGSLIYGYLRGFQVTNAGKGSLALCDNSGDIIITHSASIVLGNGTSLEDRSFLADVVRARMNFIGNGAGLTNVVGYVPTNDSLYLDIENIQTATQTLNTAVGNLNTSTATLNTAVGVLNTTTNTLNLATNSMNATVNLLVSATNALNVRAGNLEEATNSLNVNKLSRDGSIAWTGNANFGGNKATNILALQITGSSPTNNAIWTATNTLGQGAWSTTVGTDVTALKDSTNSLNLTTNSMNATVNLLVTATNELNTATNAINAVANAAVKRAGDIMTGPLTNLFLFAGNGGGLTNLAAPSATNSEALGNIAAAQWVASTQAVNSSVINLNTSSNTLNTRMGNAELATNALNANKLDKSFTNAAGVASLQVTGGATNIGILACTNSATGQAAWNVYPKIWVVKTNATVFLNDSDNIVIWTDVKYQVGGTWDNTSWTPGIGWIKMVASLSFPDIAYTGTSYWELRKNNVVLQRSGHVYVSSKTYPTTQGFFFFYNDNATNKFSLDCVPAYGANVTNRINHDITCYFVGEVVP